MKNSIGIHRKISSAILLAMLSASALSAQPKAPPPDPTNDPVMITAGFLTAHPDLRYRLTGLDKFKQQQFEDAFKFFQRASFYADKPSQAMVAEMLWDGNGTPQDRAAAYAWMDLASERGYRGFLGLRERYWAGLSEAERERALELGQAIYEKYGDDAAKPRIAKVLRRERSLMTGSRTGFAGSNLKIEVPGPAGSQSIDGSKFYDDRYWNPEKYQQWHDAIWENPMVGKVTLGEIEQVTNSPSRIPAVTPATDAVEPETPDIP